MADPAALIQQIQRVLSPDLLLPRWRGNACSLAGHCYSASEALFHLVGGRSAGAKPCSARCPGGVHWWITLGEERLDPTAEQFDPKTLEAIYSQGVGRGFLTKQPSRRALEIMRRVNLGLSGAADSRPKVSGVR